MRLIYSALILSLVLGACKSNPLRKSKTISFGGSFPKATEKFKSTNNLPTNTANESTAEPALNIAISNQTVPICSKENNRTISWPKQKKIGRIAIKNHQEPNPPKLPVEKHAQAGFWIAIGSYVLPILLQLGYLATGLEYIAAFYIAVGILAFGGMVAAFVLGLVALKIIKKEPNKYRGYGKAIAAVVIPSVMFLLTILYLLFVILLFAVLLAIL